MVALKSPLIEPPKKPAPEPHDLIDTSKMSEGQRAALELTEAARDAEHERTFAAGLFMGEFKASDLQAFQMQSVEDRQKGDVFLKELEKILREKVDPDEIDRTGEIPEQVIEELAGIG